MSDEKVPKPKDTDLVMGKDDIDAIDKARRVTPTVHELAAACGTEVREEINPRTGRREVVATGPLATIAEAMQPSWRVSDGARKEMEGRLPYETLVDERGRQERRWIGVSDGAARARKLKPVWRARGARLVVGENGNLWRFDRNGKLVDTGKKCLTRPWTGEGADDAPPTGGIVIH